MPLPPLPDSAVILGAHAADWRDAVRARRARAGRAPARPRAEYAERMIGVIEEFGAYIVIAPGLALAHARPGPDVLARRASPSSRSPSPVAFGHPHNDPVRVVHRPRASSNAEEHVRVGRRARQRVQRQRHRRPHRARDLAPTRCAACWASTRRRAAEARRSAHEDRRDLRCRHRHVGILKVNAERVLERLGLEADVIATDLASVAVAAADAQVILTSTSSPSSSHGDRARPTPTSS